MRTCVRGRGGGGTLVEVAFEKLLLLAPDDQILPFVVPEARQHLRAAAPAQIPYPIAAPGSKLFESSKLYQVVEVVEVVSKFEVVENMQSSLSLAQCQEPKR